MQDDVPETAIIKFFKLITQAFLSLMRLCD